MITAAHCVYPHGHLRQFVFVPGYRDGRAPYGVWRPRQVLVDTSWSDSADPADDVAFAVMYPSHGKNIGDVVAGEEIGRTDGSPRLLRMVGYPDAAEQPIACDNTISYVTQGLEFDCPGFTAGTSGAPWLASADPPAGNGRVVGLIGGYQDGGVSPSVSYSPVFGESVTDLYQRAVATGRELG
jgi:V8-like Glu-specific endopeptidase